MKRLYRLLLILSCCANTAMALADDTQTEAWTASQPDPIAAESTDHAAAPASSKSSLIAAVSLERQRELEVMREIELLERKLEADPPGAGHSIIRQQREQEQRFQEHIRRNSIVFGMRPDHVIQSWGKPSIVETLSDEVSKWIYHRRDGRDQIIYFDGGVVISWE